MIFFIGTTKIKLSFSFVAFIVLMIMLCEENIVLLSLVSSFIHECGHLFFMFLSGDMPQSISFTPFGIRIDKANSSVVSYKKEALIALGGIIFNIFFSVLFFILYLCLGVNKFLILSAVNTVIAAVNAFPVSVLDCGRALRYALIVLKDDASAEKYADTVSSVFIALFTGATVAYTLFLGANISLIGINLYLIFITVIKKWS
ncbi:MAG: hypothetical protein E7543_00985 [Ruminococcaceae bacterium]|nr:hypothetical protein [Oscillospiraceae bacterium]